MLKCPFCDKELKGNTPSGWECECGELVPFGFELDSEENCERCPIANCPRRKLSSPSRLNRPAK